MLASGTRVRGFKPGRSRWIFRASEKSSACLPSEGKWKNLSHIPALRHVKEPSTSVNYKSASKIPCIVPSFASRDLSCLCGAWRLWRWMRGTHWGQGYNRPIGCSAEKPHARPLVLHYFMSRINWVNKTKNKERNVIRWTTPVSRKRITYQTERVGTTKLQRAIV